MAYPQIRVNGGTAGAKAAVAATTTVNFELDSITDVHSCVWSVIGTDETTDGGDYTPVEAGPYNSEMSLTSLTAGTALTVSAVVNAGVDPLTGNTSALMTAKVKVYVPTSGGFEVAALGEDTWATAQAVAIINAAVRAAVGGAGGASNYTVTAVKTATYTVAISEWVRCNASGGGFTVNLPTAVGNAGKGITIKKTTSTANVVTVDGAGSETIDGAATYSMSGLLDCLTVVSDGANWMAAPPA